MIYEEPIFFEQNRVFRVYIGGKLLGEFAGDDSGDGFYPEEWIASQVKANNINSDDPKEGVSQVLGTNIYLDDLLLKYPEEILGEKKEIGILVKYLDSAIRLPVQAHPDKEFSKKYFSSEHGKEECWIVLGTRPGGCIYFGFKDGVDEKTFCEAIEKSRTERDVMESLLMKYEVKSGDVILVPAKCVHAIGAGCLILEIQEPTDFTIQPEYYCGDYELSEEEMYIGLKKTDALKCFDYSPIDNVKTEPKTIYKKDGLEKYELIGDESKNFSINKISLSGGEYLLDSPCGVYIVTEGYGEIFAEEYEKNIKKGDYFLLPARATENFSVKGNLTLIECMSK